MAGRKHKTKFAAALLLLLLGGFIWTTTGARAARKAPAVAVAPIIPVGPLAAPQAPVAPLAEGSDDLDGEVGTPIRVTCAPGATTGTGEVKVKVKDGTGFHVGDPIPDTLVTWNGGSTHINKYGTWFTVSSASLPCPPAAGKIVPFTFHFDDDNDVDHANLILNVSISINLGLGH
jgi:hypothetical protein